METAKPILRVGKIKKSGRSTLSSVGGHLARSRPTPNADPSRLSQNQWLIGDANLTGHVDAFMKRCGLDPAQTRKDAVVANDVLLTISPEWFRPVNNASDGGTWDADRLTSFKAEAEQMLRKTFGSRCVAAVLHLDESTPHIQAVVVPVLKTEKGMKLSSKEMFGPKQLTQLQQDWEDRMMAHGVGPREKRSKAKHTTLREYYGALEDFAMGEDDRAKIAISEPPKKGLFEKKSDHDAKVAQWRKDEAKRLRKELQPMAAAASKGRLFASEKRMRIAAKIQVEFHKERLTKLSDELNLTKEQASKLRAIPVQTVAVELGYTDTIQPKENAIDLTMRVGELNYKQATAWLAQRFGAEPAAATVRESALNALQKPQERVYTTGERVKAKIVKEQLTALSAAEYRITVMYDRDGQKIGINLGEQKLGKDKLTPKEVMGLIPDLTRMNMKGGNVFVTPLDPNVEHILVDDLKGEKMVEFIRKEYSAALLQETSPGNHQAVIKVPKTTGDKADRNEVFKDLNRAYGDEKITGLVHPIRLAGFENRKEKHLDQSSGKYPFVRIVAVANRMCEKAMGLVREYQGRRTAQEAQIRVEQERQRLEERRKEEQRYNRPSRPRMR